MLTLNIEKIKIVFDKSIVLRSILFSSVPVYEKIMPKMESFVFYFVLFVKW